MYAVMLVILLITYASLTETIHLCGKPPIPPREIERIVGGTVARPYSWPWQIELCTKSMFDVKQCNLRCGGSLIDNEWVMSAGHCVRHYEENPKYFGIKLGTYDYRDDDEAGELLRDVAEIRIHPDFGRPHRFSHDISLLRLSEPVNFTNHIHPICVPKNLKKITPKTKGFVTGWGATSEGGEVSNKLRQVLVPFLNQKECECEYEGEVDDTMVCAGRKGIDSCQGDSGGPLVTKHKDTHTWYQAGIVSWGQGCGERGHAGVYSLPSANCDFIEKFTGKQICID